MDGIGEKRLVYRVLRRAALDALGIVTLSGLDQDLQKRRKRLQAEASEWLDCDDDSDDPSPFTFLWCCLWLDLDPSSVRKTIEKLRDHVSREGSRWFDDFRYGGDTLLTDILSNTDEPVMHWRGHRTPKQEK